MPYVKHILEREMEVAIFDFIGSGESEGSYVTLGVEESRNISTVIDYIVKNKNVNDIFLWGRSMGAVAGYCFFI
jgi:alpha/beta superfamily hydrolase